MSKDIWHSKDEIPSKESRVIWKSGNVVYGGRFDTYYKCFCGPASQFVDLKSVSCWAYIDDFLALETELEHTRKALDVAVDALNTLLKEKNEHTQPDLYVLTRALKEITALEQKDVK